jgi:hypothetical protein
LNLAAGLHGDSPSLCGIARKRDFKLDLVTGTEDAAITAVTLGEVNESLNVRCRMHFQFHRGSIRSKGSGTNSRYQEDDSSPSKTTTEAEKPHSYAAD